MQKNNYSKTRKRSWECIAKWSDLNIRKEEGEGRAASLHGREGNVIAGIACCTVGAMTSLVLLVIMCTEGMMERWTEQPIS